MAVACNGYWATCIECIDKIDTLDKQTSRNFSFDELKKKNLNVDELEKEAITDTENLIRNINESKKAAILSEYDTIEKQAEKECNNTDVTQLRSEKEEIDAKIRKIKTLCKKNLTKKRTTLASKSLEKMKTKTFKKPPSAPQKEGGRRKSKRKKSRKKKKRSRRRRRR